MNVRTSLQGANAFVECLHAMRHPKKGFGPHEAGSVAPLFAVLILPVFTFMGLAFDQMEINRLRHSLQTVADETATMTASLAAELPEDARRHKGFAHLRAAIGATRIPLSKVGAKIEFTAEGKTRSTLVTLEAPPHLALNILRRAVAPVRVHGRGVDRTAAMERLAIACHSIETLKDDEKGQCLLLRQ